MTANKKNIMIRYFFITLIISLVGIAIVVKAAIIMFAERDYWNDVAARFVKENVHIKPNRGNILSADGKLMASSLPEYKIFMDFMSGEKDKERRRKDQHRRDSVWNANFDSICRGLHQIFPDVSVATFKQHLRAGRRKRSRNYNVLPDRRRRISYIQYKEAKRLPVFKQNKYRGGFHEQIFNLRKKPFGSLAARTLGDVYPDTAQGAKNGIELAFDSLLRGHDGITHRQKVMNRYLNIVDLPPVDGCDIITTIDVDMQDICEKALVDKLKELEALWGVAVLMDVKTGDVKAIVNKTRAKDGNYYEMQNLAINAMMEPGSTFKTASVMVALEDGKITPHTLIDTGNGIKMMHRRAMRDHNWHRGGYGVIDVTRAIEVSSNIGVSTLIDKHYGNNPQQFVDGLKRMSLDQPLHLQIAGEGTPNIKGPKERSNFSKADLPWMSIGYVTQLPPLNVLTFYNAIANNGTMVRPRFVTRAVKDGQTVEEYPVSVINPKICSDTTLQQIQVILERVVSHGLAKPARSDQFHISGKTGTAQVATGGSYHSGERNHLVSFCGYFPSEAPQYSCIVSIQINKGIPSGGGMAGSVFKKIAERVYAKNLYFDLKHAIDSTTNVIPSVMDGDLNDAYLVLDELDVPMQSDFDTQTGREVWGHAQQAPSAVMLNEQDVAQAHTVPRVIGMGAKDAVYLLEKAGLRVRLEGKGRVRRQSIAAGSRFRQGQYIALQLK